MDDVEPVAVGKTEIEDQSVIRDAPGGGQAVFGIRKRIGPDPEARQALDDQFGQALMVFDDERTHRMPIKKDQPPPDLGYFKQNPK